LVKLIGLLEEEAGYFRYVYWYGSTKTTVALRFCFSQGTSHNFSKI